jgi:zinc protease
MDQQWFELPDFIDYVRAELDALTLDQVNAVIRRYLKPEAAQFVFVAKDAAGLAAAIAADTPSPITYNTPKPALAEEDEAIANRPLGLPAARIQVIAADTVFE